MRRIVIAAFLLACAKEDAGEPFDGVDPFIGSGGFGFAHGSAFPGAAAPNGLAKVGPDTSGPYGTIRFLHYSGYWYGDDVVQGFSHLHLHGTGATDYGVIAVMPTDGDPGSDAGREEYASSFKKKHESASPGRYEVKLDRGRVRAEIAATTHAAIHRWTWGDGEPWVVLDLGAHLDSGTIGPVEYALDPAARRIRGRVRSIGEMSDGFGGYDVWFEAELSRAWTATNEWADGLALEFGDLDGPLLMRIGLSLVSPESAAEDLEAEIPAFDFDAVAAATAAQWDALLSRVEIEGGTPEERRMFRSALYRCFLMPTVISDGQNRFRLSDGVVRQGTHRQLSDMSLWDTYRTTHSLYALVAPEIAGEAAQSLDTFAQVMGFHPKWPIATGEAGTMIGASAEIVIADAVLRDAAAGLDASAAYDRLRVAALDTSSAITLRGGRGAVLDYMANGYVSAAYGRSASLTAEYAYDDFALANLAESLGRDADAALLRARSQSWRELWDPATQFVRARNQDGTFVIPEAEFDEFLWSDDYAEANAWQTAFAAFHDLDGLAQVHGGEAAFLTRLDAFFDSTLAHHATLNFEDVLVNATPRPYYWQGNEPDLHYPFFFALAGDWASTSERQRWILANLYGPGADGLPGNDDGGTLSAWYVLASLGLYPIPGSDLWIVADATFPRAAVHFTDGSMYVVERTGAASGPVDGIDWNGAPFTGTTLTHAEVRAGGTLAINGPAEP